MDRAKPTLPLVIAVPLVGAGAIAAWGSVTRDGAAAAEATFLALLVAGVGLAIAALAPRPGWEAVLGTAAAVLAALAVVPGPARGATVAAALAAALTLAAARALPRALAFAGGTVDLRLALAALVPLALGLQLLARGGVLLDPPGLVRTAVVIVALPGAMALAVAALARGVGGPRALLAGGALFTVGAGWWPGTVVAAAALALGVGLVRAMAGAETSLALRRALVLYASALLGAVLLWVAVAPRLGAVGLVTAALALGVPPLGGRSTIGAAAVTCMVALLAGYPWLSPRPWQKLAAAPAALVARAETIVGDSSPLALDATSPAFATSLEGEGRASALELESSLAQAAGLPAGTPVATLTVHGRDGRDARLLLHIGRETGEWAARRPGVDAPAPWPWVAWIAPEHFFGQRYRASWPLPPDFVVDRVELRRRPDLPAAVELHVFRLELVR